MLKVEEKTLHPSVLLDGQQWTLSEPLDIYSDDIPEYGCISYVWGPGRMPNSIYPELQMSHHTLHSLSAAIRHSNLTAFWIDSFSLPTDPVTKAATLESIGYIYARAKQVTAVLSPPSYSAIERMSRLAHSDTALDDVLEDLERDMWVHSVWTYQEIANAGELFFVGEDPDCKDRIPAFDFLNALGYYLTRYRKQNNMSVMTFRQKYPYVDTFEDVIADWIMGEFAERSALQIMSSLDRRVYEDPKNYYYAMIGAVTKVPSKRSSKPSVQSLAETYMRICEEKGDYSFIFTANPRDDRPGLTWRPQSGMLRSIISWHSYGDRLAGVKEAGGVRLKEVIVGRRTRQYSSAARDSLMSWLQALEIEAHTDEDIVRRHYDMIKEIGFTGSPEHIILETGIFFSQDAIAPGADIEIWISGSVRYLFGAPGIAIAKDQNGTPWYTPGVYCGLVESSMPRSEVVLPVEPSFTVGGVQRTQ